LLFFLFVRRFSTSRFRLGSHPSVYLQSHAPPEKFLVTLEVKLPIAVLPQSILHSLLTGSQTTRPSFLASAFSRILGPPSLFHFPPFCRSHLGVLFISCGVAVHLDRILPPFPHRASFLVQDPTAFLLWTQMPPLYSSFLWLTILRRRCGRLLQVVFFFNCALLGFPVVALPFQGLVLFFYSD